MTIKDFEPGQVVFVLEKVRGGNMEYRTHKRTVKAVGRKYVKAARTDGGLPDDFYQMSKDDNYLVENKDWGEPLLLFTTEEAVTDYIEWLILKIWVRENMSWNKINKYSLEQLREIRRILGAGESSGTCGD